MGAFPRPPLPYRQQPGSPGWLQQVLRCMIRRTVLARKIRDVRERENGVRRRFAT